MAVQDVSYIKLKPYQEDLQASSLLNFYNSKGFVNGETPLDADTMNTLFKMVKLNYNNSQSLYENQINNITNIAHTKDVIEQSIVVYPSKEKAEEHAKDNPLIKNGQLLFVIDEVRKFENSSQTTIRLSAYDVIDGDKTGEYKLASDPKVSIPLTDIGNLLINYNIDGGGAREADPKSFND